MDGCSCGTCARWPRSTSVRRRDHDRVRKHARPSAQRPTTLRSSGCPAVAGQAHGDPLGDAGADQGAGGGAGTRGGSGSARRPPDRRCATPCASGGWGCRCGGRPASYWDHGAPTPRPTANRLLIGRLLAAKAHASASRTSRSRSRTRSCGATSRSRTIVSNPVSPDAPPPRVYAVVRAPAGRLRLLRQIRPDTRPIIDRFTGLTCRRWPSPFARAADSCGPGVLCRRAQPGHLHPAHAHVMRPAGRGRSASGADAGPWRPRAACGPAARSRCRAVWRVPVFGRVGPPRRRVCHDRWPARHYGPGRDPPRTDGRCPAPAAPRLRAGAGAPRKGAPPVETWKWRGEKGPCRRLSGC